MWNQFVLENFHFASNLFAALALFSIFWLYFDAWIERKTLKEFLKILGFLFISISFLLHSILIESSSLVTSILQGNIVENASIIFKNIGYIFLIVGLVIDPLLPKPSLAILTPLSFSTPYLTSPLLAVTAAWLYLRRATIGLENHTKSVSLAFFVFALHELFSTHSLFKNNPNVDIFRLVSPFGPIWITTHLLLLLGSGILIVWTFSYLLKRINTQLFIIFTTTTLSIFLLTTISFTFLLLKNLSDETLSRLSTDVSVLSFALDGKKSETVASASILSNNSSIVDAITKRDRKILANESEKLLLSRKLTSVLILDDSGQVIARGEERDRIGDSFSNDTLVKRALIGETISTQNTKDGPISPVVLVSSAVPVKSADKVIGVVLVSQSIDNNFLDGIKTTTGLEVAVYGNDVLAATTISDFQGKTRPIGIKNADKNINNIVLNKGLEYKGMVSILNTPYFAVYKPIKDANNENIGMLLAGRPSSSIFETVGKSIELTFLVTVVLIVLSVLPSYLISKYIYNQLK